MREQWWHSEDDSLIAHGDNLDLVRRLPDKSFQLVYLDPPFNTGTSQRRDQIRVERDDDGDRGGFDGLRYRSTVTSSIAYGDSFDDYWDFLAPRLVEAHRLLMDSGTLYLHLDYREAHYAKVFLDDLFGRESFLNEIIWAFDYGGRSKRKWPAKHDTILMYAIDPASYYFNSEEVDREPYMAPGLVTPEKAALDKLPTDVWWHTIVSPTGREKTGYPTQKPEGVLRRIIAASSAPGDWVLDYFAGSGTTGAVARDLDRHFVLIDESDAAISVMRDRLPSTRILEPARLGVGAAPS